MSISQMKIKILFFLFLPSLILFIGSCTTFDDNPNPGNGPTDCREKFIGTWNVDDQPDRLNYTVIIEKHPLYEDEVKLKNFADLGGRAVGLVTGNTIEIDTQDIGHNYKASGMGYYINANKIQFEFILDDGIDSERRKALFTR